MCVYMYIYPTADFLPGPVDQLGDICVCILYMFLAFDTYMHPKTHARTHVSTRAHPQNALTHACKHARIHACACVHLHDHDMT